MAKQILVADDDKGLVKMMEVFLGSKGYTVIPAYDGEEALRKVKSLKPDLVILDVTMPKVDGDVVYMEMRAEPTTKSIPILFLTGLRTEKEIAEENEENTFAKPLQFEPFLAKVRELLGE